MQRWMEKGPMSTSVVILQNEDKLANIEIIIIKHDYWRVFLLHVTRKKCTHNTPGYFLQILLCPWYKH